MYDGGAQTWDPIEDGLTGVTDVNQMARAFNVNVHPLYTATDLGFYKIYDITSQDLTWSARTYGLGTPNLGSVVADPSDPCALMVATAPNVSPPQIWASGDSGRSWIELPLGEMDGIEDLHINRLAASQDITDGGIHGGFAALTNYGAFAFADIFKSGEVPYDDTWGPGVVIVNGDYTVGHGATLTIEGPCTVYFTYLFDNQHLEPGNRPQLQVQSSSILRTVADDNNRILFTSSRPTGKSAGDWDGIALSHRSTTDLQYCDIEYATTGISENPDDYDQIGSLNVDHCTFYKMSNAGIDLYRSADGAILTISNSSFTQCGQYGIRFYQDYRVLPVLLSVSISHNEIVDCGYGVWYSGNSNASHQKVLNLLDNHMTFTTPSPSSQYGIYVTRSSSAGVSPIVKIDGEDIEYYAQGGIWLNFTHGASSIDRGRVYRCGFYGIRFSNAMAQIIGQSSSVYSVVDSCCLTSDEIGQIEGLN